MLKSDSGDLWTIRFCKCEGESEHILIKLGGPKGNVICGYFIIGEFSINCKTCQCLYELVKVMQVVSGISVNFVGRASAVQITTISLLWREKNDGGCLDNRG